MCGSRLDHVPSEAAGEKVNRFLANARDRARFAIATVTAQSAARRRLAAIDSELRRLGGERERALLALGDATYRGDDEAAQRARDRLRALDDQIEEQRRQQERVVAETRDFVEHERGFVEPTQIVHEPDADRKDAS
jgi:hypothetical protein